ncbi:hypothetical protein M8J77_007907 [Diaphorina citri]|nr:hypothetical protein M8J77_007907 [Diaphorina citri]
MWCPSHCGIRGNEDVDQAARNPTDLDQLKLCSPDDFKPLAASLTRKEWQDQWNLVPVSNKLKSIKPLITNWDTSNQENRTKEITLTRMRIGHTRLTHGFIFTKTDPPICPCGERLSVRHILTCHRHAQIRASLPHPPSLADDVEGVKSLFTYLQKIDIYHLI